MKINTFINNTFILLTVVMLFGCSTATTPSSAASPSVTTANAAWNSNAGIIWISLQQLPLSKLTNMQNDTTDPVKRAWLKLAIISKQKHTTTAQLTNELIGWRERHPSHPANQLIPNNTILNQLKSQNRPQQIAILLPQSGPYAAQAQIVREGFLNSYYANQPTVGQQRIKFYNTDQTPNIAMLYQQAIADGADFIIGPLAKENVQQLSGTNALRTPTLALNYTDTFSSLPNNFYEFGLLPEDEVAQIAQHAYIAGHANAIIIAPQNAWGERLVNAFGSRWQANGGRIQSIWYYTEQSNFNEEIAHLLNVNPTIDKKLMQENNDKDFLKQQRRNDFDVIFLFAQSKEAHTIVPLLRYYYAGDVPIYATSAIYSSKFNSEKNVDLNGVIICDIPRKIETGNKNRLYALGQDAYLLSSSFTRLTALANFPLYGSTGALMLSSKQQIHRRLPCVSLRNGFN